MSQKINHSKIKKYESILKLCDNSKKCIKYGAYFKDPTNELIRFKEHLYSLFLLLFYHGELEHKQQIIKHIIQCKEYHKQLNQQMSQNPSRRNFEEMYDFVIAELNLKQQKREFHTIEERQWIRNTFKQVLLLKNLLTYRTALNFLQFTQIAGSLIGAKCKVKDYYDFQLIQFQNECFEKKKLDVFIQISREHQRYSYIKRTRNILILLNQQKQANKQISDTDFKKCFQQMGIDTSENQYNNLMFKRMINEGKSQENSVHDEYDEDGWMDDSGNAASMDTQKSQSQSKKLDSSKTRRINIENIGLEYDQKQKSQIKEKKSLQALKKQSMRSSVSASERDVIDKKKGQYYYVQDLDQSLKGIVQEVLLNEQDSQVEQSNGSGQKNMCNFQKNEIKEQIQKDKQKEKIGQSSKMNEQDKKNNILNLQITDQCKTSEVKINEIKQTKKGIQKPIQNKSIKQIQNSLSEKEQIAFSKTKQTPTRQKIPKNNSATGSPGKIIKNSRVRQDEKISKSADPYKRKYQYSNFYKCEPSIEGVSYSLNKYDHSSHVKYRPKYTYNSSMFEKWRNYDETTVQNYIRRQKELCQALEEQKRKLLISNYSHFSMRPSQAIIRKNRWGLDI